MYKYSSSVHVQYSYYKSTVHTVVNSNVLHVLLRLLDRYSYEYEQTTSKFLGLGAGVEHSTPAERVAGGEQRRVGAVAAHVGDGGLDVLERECAVCLRSLRAPQEQYTSNRIESNTLHYTIHTVYTYTVLYNSHIFSGGGGGADNLLDQYCTLE